VIEVALGLIQRRFRLRIGRELLEWQIGLAEQLRSWRWRAAA